MSDTIVSDGRPITSEDVMAGCGAYYVSIGWKVVAAKRVEAYRDQILATMYQENSKPVMIDPYSIDERPLPVVLDNYEPWMLTFVPVTENNVD